MYGIINQPLVPIRREPSERAEMVSEALLGEQVEILETTDKWLKIRILSDKYEGFADRKMIYLPSEAALEQMRTLPLVRIKVPVGTVLRSDGQRLRVPFGAAFHVLSSGEMQVADEMYSCNARQICASAPKTSAEAIRVARMFLGAPYRWGGKTVFGIDCSGLVQIVFSHTGILLPRDASQQVCCGVAVPALASARAGDVAFFSNETDNITHTGILLSNRKIIHSSGCVKIENIDSKGIISAANGKYSHRLRSIRGFL